MQKVKSSLRTRADDVKKHICKNLVVVIENPQAHKNIGTIVRNVNALVAEKVYVVDEYGICPQEWCDMREQGTMFKTSASAIEWTFVKVFTSTQECIDHLRKRNFTSVVTSPHVKGKENVVLHEGNFTQKMLAVWFGNESKGISDLAVRNSDFCINIPMYGIIESLNLGTSTGIVLYEITRQRRAYVQSKRQP